MINFNNLIRTSLLLISFALVPSLLKAYGAGILPYAYLPNGQAILLLGYEPGRGWCDFTGGDDRSDHVPGDWLASAANTAVREFNEESLMMYSGQTVAKLVNKALKDSKYIHHSHHQKGHYYLFAADFTNAFDKKGNKGLAQAKAFRKKRKALIHQHGGGKQGKRWLRKHGAEKTNFVVVQARDFLKMLKNIKNGNINKDGSANVATFSRTFKSVAVWPTFVRVLKAHINQAITLVKNIIKHR